MSTTTLEAPQLTECSNSDSHDFSELVDQYALPADLPSAEWLTDLNLTSPRRDVRCLTEHTRLFKRLTDIAISASLLVMLSPVLLVVAILVKMSSPGPFIFRQTRVGLNLRRPKRDRRHERKKHLQQQSQEVQQTQERRRPGQDRRAQGGYGMPFVLYKFRTMRTDAERNGAQFATKGDPRVTRLGRIMRKTRLDELPQLWNVLRGDMSLVGPRPERPEFIKKLSDEIPDYIQRLGLRPGLTGVAQVVNGYDNDIESFRRKVAYDLLYLQNCCLWNDLKIMFRTIGVVITGSGAL